MHSNVDSTEDTTDSIVRPGTRIFSLPPPLLGEFAIPPKAHWEGMYSNIYRGTWTIDGEAQMVCLKYLRRVELGSKWKGSPQERIDRRLLRETVIWKGAEHGNIYPFIGYTALNGEYYLVSPWAENGSLEAYLKKTPEISRVSKLKMLKEATQGLAFLHSQIPVIVHGDLKPANILITEDLVAALCDFGVSRVMVQLGFHTGLTTSGGSPGTPGYQAPELVDEDLGGVASPGSDMYAMAGVVLMVMSGVKPFAKKRSAGAVILAINRGEMCQPCDHPNLPEKDQLWGFLRRCWSYDPNARPTATELIDELNEAMIREDNPANA